MKRILKIIVMLTAVLCLSFAFAACDDSAKIDPKPPITNNQDEQESQGEQSGNQGEQSGNQDQQGNQEEQGGEQHEQGDNSGNVTPKPDEEKDEPHTHHFEDYVYNNNATCTRDGTETGKCSCGQTDTRTKAGTALGHTFEKYISNGDATCLENGTETATCIRCTEQDTREEQNSALGHDMQPVEAKEPTCTEIGWDTYQKCSRCDETQNYTEKQALGHDYQNDFCTRCQKQESSVGLSYALAPDAKGYMVIGRGSCEETNIVIAPVYNEKPVIEICARAFYHEGGIISVKIPSSIVKIGEFAFYGCGVLQSVLFGENSQLTWIGEEVFEWCSSLTEITIPAGVTSIKDRTFWFCSSLTEVTIPAGVTSIGEHAFNRIRDTAKNQKNLLKRSLSRA